MFEEHSLIRRLKGGGSLIFLFVFVILFSDTSISVANDESHAASIVGSPLSSYRTQTLNSCWAIHSFHHIEGNYERLTGYSISHSLNTHFWHEIYKNRLLLRWKKGAQLGGGLHDGNIFSEMGFP